MDTAAINLLTAPAEAVEAWEIAIGDLLPIDDQGITGRVRIKGVVPRPAGAVVILRWIEDRSLEQGEIVTGSREMVTRLVREDAA